MVLKEWILLTNIIRTVIYYINSLLLVFEKRNIKHEMTNSPLSNIDENLTKDEYESIMNTSKKQENLEIEMAFDFVDAPGLINYGYIRIVRFEHWSQNEFGDATRRLRKKQCSKT